MTTHKFHKTKVKVIHFFNKIKLIYNRNRHQTSYYTPNYSSSDDDDYYQPDIFAPYTQKHKMRQCRLNPTSQNNNFYPQNLTSTQSYQPLQVKNPVITQSYQPIQMQNPAITHSYQPTQMQNEIPLPYYLQQYEITKSQLTNFSQMQNAAESPQMTMNPYLMGGSSITSNKPLIVFTGTDPEYSIEEFLNAVTANLILNIGPEPKIHHFTKIGYIDAQRFYKPHLMAQVENGFQFYL